MTTRAPNGSLSNVFTSAFKELGPIPQFKATAKLGRIPGGPVLTVVLPFQVAGVAGGSRAKSRFEAARPRPGEVEQEEGVLVIRTIHVSVCLVAPEDVKEKVDRAHALYPMNCPLYRTLQNAIRLTSSLELARFWS